LIPEESPSTAGNISNRRTNWESRAFIWYMANFSAFQKHIIVSKEINDKSHSTPTNASPWSCTKWHTLESLDAHVSTGVLESLGPESARIIERLLVVAHGNEAHDHRGALGHLGAI